MTLSRHPAHRLATYAIFCATLGWVVVVNASGGEDSETGDEWVTLEIPQIGGGIDIPSNWHQPTSEQALEGLDYLHYDSQEDRGLAEMQALAIGRKRVWITRDPEPSPEFNPGIDITWEGAPPIMRQVPAESVGEALAQIMATSVIPEVKKHSKNFQLLEGPKPMSNGAWATFRIGTPLKSGEIVDAVARFVLLYSGDNFLMITIGFPSDKEEADKVVPTLWKMFGSLRHGN